MAGEQIKKTEDLVRQLKLAVGKPEENNWGSAVFLIGAGCSKSAGIPLAAEIAQYCVVELAAKYSGESAGITDPIAALNWLVQNGDFDKEWAQDRKHTN